MELEQTEQEQVEALQKWWRENWLSLVGGLVLGLGGILGWQYWGEAQQQNAAAASESYEAIKTKIVINRLDAARADITKLADEHSGSPYVTQARLALAQAQAEGEDWAAAEQTLRTALADTDDKALAGLIRLRLARSLWAQGKADAAMSELNAEAGAYTPVYQDLKGDIALAQGDTDTARSAYEQALASDAQFIDRNAIQRKLDALN